MASSRGGNVDLAPVAIAAGVSVVSLGVWAALRPSPAKAPASSSSPSPPVAGAPPGGGGAPAPPAATTESTPEPAAPPAASSAAAYKGNPSRLAGGIPPQHLVKGDRWLVIGDELVDAMTPELAKRSKELGAELWTDWEPGATFASTLAGMEKSGAFGPGGMFDVIAVALGPGDAKTPDPEKTSAAPFQALRSKLRGRVIGANGYSVPILWLVEPGLYSAGLFEATGQDGVRAVFTKYACGIDTVGSALCSQVYLGRTPTTDGTHLTAENATKLAGDWFTWLSSPRPMGKAGNAPWIV